MRRIFVIMVIATLGSIPPVSAVDRKSPYAGQEERPIKALSDGEIRGYLRGDGMGFARAAELNHYPGPKHVLELAEQLALSETQRRETQTVYERMNAEAVRLGRRLVDLEASLDSIFSTGAVTPRVLEERVRAIALIEGELRLAHLQAHLAQRPILLDDQARKYDALRGYDGAHRHGHGHGGGH